jgi:hypothetical protein
MGLDVLVTRSAEDYVTLASRLLQDHGLRREMAEAMADVAGQSRSASGSAIGHHVGDALLKALKRKLNTAVI